VPPSGFQSPRSLYRFHAAEFGLLRSFSRFGRRSVASFSGAAGLWLPFADITPSFSATARTAEPGWLQSIGRWVPLRDCGDQLGLRGAGMPDVLIMVLPPGATRQEAVGGSRIRAGGVELGDGRMRTLAPRTGGVGPCPCERPCQHRPAPRASGIVDRTASMARRSCIQVPAWPLPPISRGCVQPWRLAAATISAGVHFAIAMSVSRDEIPLAAQSARWPGHSRPGALAISQIHRSGLALSPAQVAAKAVCSRWPPTAVVEGDAVVRKPGCNGPPKGQSHHRHLGPIARRAQIRHLTAHPPDAGIASRLPRILPDPPPPHRAPAVAQQASVLPRGSSSPCKRSTIGLCALRHSRLGDSPQPSAQQAAPVRTHDLSLDRVV